MLDVYLDVWNSERLKIHYQKSERFKLEQDRSYLMKKVILFFILYQVNVSREIVMIISQIDGHNLINNYLQPNLNLVLSYSNKSERSWEKYRYSEYVCTWNNMYR